MQNTVPSPTRLSSSDLSPVVTMTLLVVVSLLFGYTIITYLEGGIGDEDVHRYQIYWFLNGRFEIYKYVTMIPLYHATVAGLAKLTGLISLDGMRFVHMLISASVVPAMYRLVGCFYPQEAISRTLLLLFIPFFFPLFFLTYTDPLSLAVILFFIERAWNKHYITAGIVAFVAVLVRQTNIIWIGFTVLAVVLQIAQSSTSDFRWRLFFDRYALFNLNFLKTVIKPCLTFVPVIIAFIIFVFINGGVAVGDADQHQISLNLSNLYFFMLVAFVLFLPLNIEQVPAIARLLRRHLWVLLLLGAIFYIYYVTFGHPHKYNSTALSFYRHNLILHYVCDFVTGRVLAFIPIAWMGLTLTTMLISDRNRHLIGLMLIFALFSFVPLPLIEQRYYMVTLALLLVLRPSISRLSSVLTLLVFMSANAYILFSITHKHFFL